MSSSRRRALLAGTALGLALTLGGGPSRAQVSDEEAVVLDEVSAVPAGEPADQGVVVEGGGGAITLDTLVVTGGRAPQRLAETAKTVYVVEEEAVQEQARAGYSVSEILAHTVPSFDVGYSGSRTNYGQNIRGRGVLVLIDGVSLNSARSVSRQFDSIDPFNIARIEVLSGATAIYGGNSTGGIVNIITKKGSDAGPGLHAEFQAGAQSGFNDSNDRDLEGAAAVTYSDDRFDSRIAVALSDTGAFYDGNGDIIVPDITQTTTQFNTVADLHASFGAQITPDQRIEVTAQHYSSGQDSDVGIYFGPGYSGLSTSPDLIGVREGYLSDLEPSTDRWMSTVSYTNDDFFGQDLLLQAFYRTERLDFHPFPYPRFTGGVLNPAASYISGSEQDTDVYGFKAAMVSEPTDRLKLTYGVDGDVDQFSSSQNLFDVATAARTGGLVLQQFDEVGRYPGIEVSSLAGFVEASFDVTDRFAVSGGFRHQAFDVDVDDFVAATQQIYLAYGLGTSADAIPGGSTSYSANLFNAGATFDLADGHQIYANYSQGFEIPDPAKYFGQGEYSPAPVGGRWVLLNSIAVGNSTLEAITTDSVEAGYRFSESNLSGQFAAYYSLSDKALSYDRNTFTVIVNDQERRVFGVEGQLTAWFDNGFKGGVQGHFTRTEVENAAGGWDKGLVTDASISKVGGFVGWENANWDIRLQSQYLFDYEDDAGNEIDGFALFDLITEYQLPWGDQSVTFGVLNLFDNDYTTLWGQRAQVFYGSLGPDELFDYKGRGRTYSLTYTAKF